MFNAVLEEIQFDSDDDERQYNAERLRRQVIAFFCIKKEMFTDWITGHITNIYGCCDKDSEMEPGPFSIKSYLKYMLRDCVWGDFIVLNLISAMWGVRISVVRGDSCAEVRIRHNCELIESDVVILFNGRELAGNFSAVSRVDQSKTESHINCQDKGF